MKKYRDNDGRRVVEVDSLAFLYERHGYSWLKRHALNRRHKRALKRADIVTAPDAEVAYEIEKYYFIPKETVTVPPKIKRRDARLSTRPTPEQPFGCEDFDKTSNAADRFRGRERGGE